MSKIIVAILAVCLAVGAYFSFSKSSEQEAEIAQLEQAVATLRSENHTLSRKAGVAEGEGEPPVVGDSGLTVTDAGAAAGSVEVVEGKESPMSGFAKMMDNPVMRSQIEMQMKTQVEMTYGKLLKDQGFADDEVDALSEILLDRQMALTEIGMKAMGGDRSDRVAATDEAEAVKSTFDSELKELLGEDRFSELERFEQTQMERQQIDSLKSQLASSDNPLTGDQEQKLMDVMWEVREDPKFSKLVGGDLKGLSTGTSFPEDTGAMLDGMASLQEEVRSRARFLEADQLEALEQNQKGFLEMMKMGIEMSKQMSGGGGGGEGGN